MDAMDMMTRLLRHRREQLQQDLAVYEQRRAQSILPDSQPDVQRADDLTQAFAYHARLAQAGAEVERQIVETQAALQAQAREERQLAHLVERQAMRRRGDDARRAERELWENVLGPRMLKGELP